MTTTSKVESSVASIEALLHGDRGLFKRLLKESLQEVLEAAFSLPGVTWLTSDPAVPQTRRSTSLACCCAVTLTISYSRPQCHPRFSLSVLKWLQPAGCRNRRTWAERCTHTLSPRRSLVLGSPSKWAEAS